MTTTSEYQSRAEECLRWAEETDNDQRRQAFLDMAVAWLHVAPRGQNAPAQAPMPAILDALN